MAWHPGRLLRYAFLAAALCTVVCLSVIRAILENHVAELKCLQSFAWDVDLDGQRFGCHMPYEAQGLAEFTHPGPIRVYEWYLSGNQNPFKYYAGRLLLFGRLRLQAVRFYPIIQADRFYSADFLRGLRRFPEIRRLELSGLKAPLGELQVLSFLPNLEELRLDWTAIDDNVLSEIANKPQLQILSLRGTRISSAAVNGLRCPQLRSLDISGTDIDDAALPALSSLPRLETLMIGPRQFSPRMRERLEQLPGLKELRIVP